MKKIKTKALAMSLACALLVGTAVIPAAAAPEPLPSTQSCYKAPTKEGLMENLELLCGESGIGPHSMGTPEEKHNAELFAQQFKSYNPDFEVQVIEQDLNGTPYISRAQNLARIAIEGERPVYGLYHGPEGTAFPETASVIDCGTGAAEEFPEDLTGMVALIQRKDEKDRTAATEEEKAAVDLAVEKGAAGVVFATSVAATTKGASSQMQRYTAPIPCTVIQKEYAEVLRQHLNTPLAFSALKTDKTWSTEAVLKPASGKSDGIIYVTAHYDSVLGGPGANDNGSGAAMLMELAELYSHVETNMELRFVAFGGEEYGLIGSRLYVENLPQEDIDRILCVLNTDEVATSNPDWNYLSAEVVGGRMNLSASLVTAAMGDLMDSLPQDTDYRTYTFGSTDHQPFHDAGVDACGFFRGDRVENSEPGNHTAADTIEGNISPERLEAAGKIMSKALARVIDANPTTQLALSTAPTGSATVLTVENTDQITGLSHSLTAEYTSPSGKTATVTLPETEDAYTLTLDEDGEYQFHFYATGTGVTNWGNAHGEEYAEEDYTIDFGSYTVTASKALPVDKSKLQAEVEAAEKIENEGYTEQSWTAFTTALDNAKTVLADPDAEQNEVDEALDALTQAMKALAPEPSSENPAPSDTPSSGTSGTGSTASGSTNNTKTGDTLPLFAAALLSAAGLGAAGVLRKRRCGR